MEEEKKRSKSVCKKEKLIWKKGVRSQIELGSYCSQLTPNYVLLSDPGPQGNRPGCSRLPREGAAVPRRRPADTRTLLISWHPINADPNLNLRRSHFFPFRGRS